MEVPSLIEPVLKRVADVRSVESPCAVHVVARTDRHDVGRAVRQPDAGARERHLHHVLRSEEHTSELQSPCNLVCRLLLVKKKYSTAFIVFPGGLSTVEELFVALTLIQTGKVLHFPVVLFERTYV